MQRPIGWRLVIASVVLMLAMAQTHPAAAAGNATLALQPAAADTTAGGEVVVEVAVRDVESLFGFEAHLSFDAALLEVVDAAPAQDGAQVELLDAFLKPDFVAQNQADNALGTIDLALTQLAPSAPATGGGVLARIALRARAPGVAAIDVLSVILADDKGQPLPVTAEGASLTIRSAAAESAQPSATATEAAGQPTPTLPADTAGAADAPTATVTATTLAVPTPTSTAAASPTATAPAATDAASAATATPGPTATVAGGTPAATAQAAAAVVATDPAPPTATQAATVAAAETPAAAVATGQPAATVAATTVAEPTATIGTTPARQAMAVSEAPSGEGDDGQGADLVTTRRSPLASLWFILIVVSVLIVGSVVPVVVIRERRRRAGR